MGQSQDIDMEETKQFTINIAKEAGKIAKEKFGQIKEYRNKERAGQMVCEVDVACEDLIKKRILEKYPDHEILAEESVDKGEMPKDSEYLWVIDPIDGTRNYLHGHPSFGISIALARDKEVILGVVYLPMYDWIYTALKGKGAEKNGEKIHVSDRMPGKDDLMSTFGCNFLKNKEAQIEMFSRNIDVVKKVRIEGAAVIAFCFLAEGIYDSYIASQTKPWDFAASCLIVEEAGGRVTDHDGNPWSLDMTKFVASSNKFHDKLLKVVKGE